MAIDYPNSPSLNDQFTVGTTTWMYNGTAWVVSLGDASIATGAITADKIASDAVTTAKILDANVTAAKLASGAAVSNIGYTPANIAGPTFTGTVVLPSTTSIGTVSSTEIGYVDGVTSAIQTQLDSKLTATTATTSNRNVVINGAMQVAQRGTSVAGLTTSANLQYLTADRFCIFLDGLGIWTQSVEADAPTGSGFRNSVKMLCTTADASPSANDLLVFRQAIEGQNLHQFLKGTASAKPFTLSFWVKSNVTGTYILDLRDADNTRGVSAAYTISVSATWEKKTITFPADTTGVFDNDNGRSLDLSFHLGSGSNYTTGTLPITWGTFSNTNRFVGGNNVASAINNYWQITGVQLEAGAVATPFEFEDFGTTLEKCQRYYQKSWAYATVPLTGATVVGLQFGGSYTATPQGNSFGQITFVKPFRANPTVTIYSYVSATAGVVSNATGTDLAANSGVAQFISEKSANVYNTSGGTITPGTGGFVWHFVASSEL